MISGLIDSWTADEGPKTNRGSSSRDLEQIDLSVRQLTESNVQMSSWPRLRPCQPNTSPTCLRLGHRQHAVLGDFARVSRDPAPALETPCRFRHVECLPGCYHELFGLMLGSCKRFAVLGHGSRSAFFRGLLTIGDIRALEPAV